MPFNVKRTLEGEIDSAAATEREADVAAVRWADAKNYFAVGLPLCSFAALVEFTPEQIGRRAHDEGWRPDVREMIADLVRGTDPADQAILDEVAQLLRKRRKSSSRRARPSGGPH
jgi:hypothetical protein